MFNLHTNMRPCKSYPGNPLNYRGNKITNPSGEDVPIDQVVFRENTEGHVRRRGVFPVARIGLHRAVRKSENEEVERQGWAGKYRALHSHHERARLHQHLQTSIRVRQENRTQTRHADRKTECAARDRWLDDALLHAMWPRIIPDICADEANIDAICMWMFKNPQDYSVLVAENMFGDIVSDLCAGLVGGLGFAPSANLGDNYAVFEPTHGSAPKYSGQYKVNPIAMLLTAKLMLDWLKETEMATRLEIAIARVIAEGKVRTYDMGGKASTLDVAKADRRLRQLTRPTSRR